MEVAEEKLEEPDSARAASTLLHTKNGPLSFKIFI
jgi:hypothetical protein